MLALSPIALALVARSSPIAMRAPAVGDVVPESVRAAVGIEGSTAALFFINRDDVFEDFKLTLAVHQALGAFESAGCKPVVIRNPERGGALPSKKDDYSSTTERFPGLAFHEDLGLTGAWAYCALGPWALGLTGSWPPHGALLTVCPCTRYGSQWCPL